MKYGDSTATKDEKQQLLNNNEKKEEKRTDRTPYNSTREKKFIYQLTRKWDDLNNDLWLEIIRKLTGENELAIRNLSQTSKYFNKLIKTDIKLFSYAPVLAIRLLEKFPSFTLGIPNNIAIPTIIYLSNEANYIENPNIKSSSLDERIKEVKNMKIKNYVDKELQYLNILTQELLKKRNDLAQIVNKDFHEQILKFINLVELEPNAKYYKNISFFNQYKEASQFERTKKFKIYMSIFILAMIGLALVPYLILQTIAARKETKKCRSAHKNDCYNDSRDLWGEGTVITGVISFALSIILGTVYIVKLTMRYNTVKSMRDQVIPYTDMTQVYLKADHQKLLNEILQHAIDAQGQPLNVDNLTLKDIIKKLENLMIQKLEASSDVAKQCTLYLAEVQSEIDYLNQDGKNSPKYKITTITNENKQTFFNRINTFLASEEEKPITENTNLNDTIIPILN